MPTKILVVDDSATMRRVLEMTFAGEDAQVVTVDNGEAAVAKAAETSPDVVFADASLSGVDGYEVARRIKAHGGKTAVILMASQHHPYDDGKGRSAGVDDHISKPFDTQSVIDRVTQVLSKPRAATGTAPAIAAPAPAAPKPAAPAVASAATSTGRTPLAGRTVMGVQPPIQPAPVARPAAPAPVPVPAAPVARPAPAGTTVPFAPMSAPPARPAPAPAPAPAAPAPAAARPATAAAVTAATGGMAAKLNGLGLSKDQVESILSLTREVVEQVVWEVVPDLAEQIIKEEIKRLTAD